LSLESDQVVNIGRKNIHYDVPENLNYLNKRKYSFRPIKMLARDENKKLPLIINLESMSNLSGDPSQINYLSS